MINTNNYEIWFLDFAEGKLSDEETVVLYKFLNNNPELQKEFDDFDIIKLKDETPVFKEKNSLKQSLNIEKIKGLNDFEILAIKKIENDISIKEEKELNSLISFSNNNQMEFKLLQKTKLIPDKSHVFTKKSNLKRKSSIIIPMWIQYASSIAAIGLLILFVNKIINQKPDIENKNVFVENILTNKKDDNYIKTTTTDSQFSENKIVSTNIEDKNRINKQISDLAIVTTKKETLNNTDNITSSSIVRSIIKVKPVDKHINDRNIQEFVLINTQGGIDKIIPLKSRTIGSPKIDINYNSYKNQNQYMAYSKNNPLDKIVALTPKELAIKTIKVKLDMDNDYKSLDIVSVASSAINKTNIANIDYNSEEDSDSKSFAFNIGSFSFSRIWSSN